MPEIAVDGVLSPLPRTGGALTSETVDSACFCCAEPVFTRTFCGAGCVTTTSGSGSASDCFDAAVCEGASDSVRAIAAGGCAVTVIDGVVPAGFALTGKLSGDAGWACGATAGAPLLFATNFV